MNSIGWHAAPDCGASLMTGEEANDALRPDESVDVPFVLLIGDTTCAGLAIEGTREELQAFANYVSALVTNITEE